MSNNNPFNPWWYYEMGKDATKHPNREVSNGAFAVIVVCFILSLILFGVFVVLKPSGFNRRVRLKTTCIIRVIRQDGPY